MPLIDPDEYSGHGTGFDSRSLFTILNFYCKSFAIFWVENSLSVHIDNKKKRYSCWWKSNTRIRWYHNNTIR